MHQTTGFKRTSIELSASGVLTVKTCLVDTSPGRSHTPVNSPIALEYGHSAKGRWKQLIAIEPTYGVPYCPDRSPLWTISVNAPDQNAYYRLRFAGTQTLRVSVSKVRHLWREDTRITDFKVSPRHVHAKGAITISGRLWRAATTQALQLLAGLRLLDAVRRAQGRDHVHLPRRGLRRSQQAQDQLAG